MIPHYTIRHLAGAHEELSCFRQLEDESAALYFNIVHGAKVRRRFTTTRSGVPCTDYVLIARPGIAATVEAQGFDWLCDQVAELLRSAEVAQ